ncbi:MAG: OmpA family protein [Xanthomonadaceae bacterium]|nr:OmpA family protein [Xanthomonadaceae bacterium]
MKRMPMTGLLWLALAFMPCAFAADKSDPELEALRESLAELDGDARLGALAGVERLKARQAVEQVAGRKSDARAHAVLIAQRRIAVAQAAAELELAQGHSESLDRERDQILLEAARRDAEMARREAENLRMLSLTRAEEIQRERSARELSAAEAEAAQAEAEQARRLAEARAREASLARREAELASATAATLRMQLDGLVARREARGEAMALSGDVFATGQSALRPEARDNLSRLIEFVQRRPDAQVLIEGHTDSSGSASQNQALSEKRAQTVRQALIEEGVDPRRLTAVGMGQGQPIGDNRTAEGRARNRRVEVIVLD